MTDYEIGRKARRDGEPLEANPYWGWFRRAAWERGWTEQNRAHATWATAKQLVPPTTLSTKKLASA
jgi:hypothetical protein